MSMVRAVRCLLGLLRGLHRLLLGTLGHTAAERQGLRERPIVVDNGAFERCLPGIRTASAGT